MHSIWFAQFGCHVIDSERCACKTSSVDEQFAMHNICIMIGYMTVSYPIQM